MKDFHSQVPCLPKLHDVLLCDKRGRPSALKARSGHGRRSEAPDRSLGCWNSRQGKDSIEHEKEKRTDLGLFIKRVNIKHPPRGRLGLA